MSTTVEPEVGPIREVVVAAVERAAEDIVSVTLRSGTGEDLPAWSPGSHVDLLLPGDLVRQYSLCGSPADRATWRIGVLRERDGRGGSAYVHDLLRAGDRVRVAGPRNHFALEPAKRYLFLAGGIGVTPLIPLAEQARAQGEVSFVYCARSRRAMGYLTQLERDWGADLVVNADDEVGLFDVAGYLAEPEEETLIYACGPAPFLDAVAEAARAWPSGALHVEHFTPAEHDTSGDTAFDVELSLSGRTLRVPADRSVLQVLRDHDVPILSSCTEGTCGTCEVPVLEGEIDHRDVVLSDEEKDSGEMMMVCVSRCRGPRLVLEI